jgi:hypothetical protein
MKATINSFDHTGKFGHGQGLPAPALLIIGEVNLGDKSFESPGNNGMTGHMNL